MEVKGHSSSLSVISQMKHCVLSELLLNTTPIKNLLSRVQDPLDPNSRVQVGLGIEGHVLSPFLVSLKVHPAISLFNSTHTCNMTPSYSSLSGANFRPQPFYNY